MGKLDDQLESQLHEFNLSCAVWQHEINVALDGYKAMQEKHAQLADRVAELELREQLVQEKEAAVQMNLSGPEWTESDECAQCEAIQSLQLIVKHT